MARKPKTEENVAEQPIATKEDAVKKTEEKVPAFIDKLMRLYPQYKQLYITKDGFVHPSDVPAYLVEDATLYENKYYKNK